MMIVTVGAVNLLISTDSAQVQPDESREFAAPAYKVADLLIPASTFPVPPANSKHLILRIEIWTYLTQFTCCG